MTRFRCREVVFPKAATRNPFRLLRFIANAVGHAMWEARLTRAFMVFVCLCTMVRAWTGIWDWSGLDAYLLVLLAGSLLMALPLGMIVEEFFHAVTPLAKQQPELLHSVVIGDLCRGNGEHGLLYLFSAIKHRGERSPRDDIHISATGPLGLICVVLIGFGGVQVVRAFTDLQTIVPLVLLVPLLVSGLLSLIPAKFVFSSDGANIENARRRLQCSRSVAAREAIAGFLQVVAYLGRTLVPGRTKSE